ncbi:MAG: hypothetical protein C0469_03970 [Cyanobacteria bacterium DS2.3.42]|nr:hypothetical protein [Cyanobacteria bacterium DS2.3.42]
MFSWRQISLGKHWVETEAITLFPESDWETLKTCWTSEKNESTVVHNFTLSTGLVDTTIPFPAKVLKVANKDNYVQRRIRRKLKKTFRFLV